MLNAMVSIILSTTLAVGSAQAEDKTVVANQSSAETAARADANPGKRYCVVTTLTGSRVPRKECHTRSEWLAEGFDPLAPR